MGLLCDKLERKKTKQNFKNWLPLGRGSFVDTLLLFSSLSCVFLFANLWIVAPTSLSSAFPELAQRPLSQWYSG